MAKNKKNIVGFDLSKLNINDAVSLKFMMLVEGTYSIGVKESLAKYGYTEQRYYQLLKSFKENGMDGLVDKKTGPKSNSKRSESSCAGKRSRCAFSADAENVTVATCVCAPSSTSGMPNSFKATLSPL